MTDSMCMHVCGCIGTEGSDNSTVWWAGWGTTCSLWIRRRKSPDINNDNWVIWCHFIKLRDISIVLQ